MSDQLASGILDSLRAFAAVLDADGTLLDANSAALAPAGLTLDAVRGKKFWDCPWWSESEAIRRQVRSACERAGGGESARYTGAVRMGDTRMDIDLRITPLRDATGRVRHLLPAAAELVAAEQPRQTSTDRSMPALPHPDMLVGLVEHAPIAIAVLEGEALRYTFANPSYRAILGPRTELVGRRFAEIFPEAAARGAEERLRAVLRSQSPARVQEFETPLTGRDELTYWDVTGVPLPPAAGQSGSLLLLKWEITEQKRAEQALRESEARERAKAAELSIILDAVPATVFIAEDPECRVIRANRVGYDLLGLSERLNVSKTPGPDAPPVAVRFTHGGIDIPPHELPMQRAAARGEKIRSYEMDVVREDGSIRRLLGNASPLFDAEGRARGAIGAFTDITERTRTEDALRHTHILIEGITRGSEDLIAAEDKEFRYIYFNDAYRREFQKLWGLRIEIGTSMLEGMAAWPDEQRKARELWTRALNGETFSTTAAFGPSEEQKQVYDLRFNPVYDGEGRQIGAAHILRNVTTQARTQEALRKSEAALRDADARKDEFLAMLAHELRNPLAPIVNAVQLLKLPAGTPAQKDWAVDLIERQTGQLSHLIDDLLDIARIVRNRIELRRTDAELGSLAEHAADSWRGSFDEKGITLSVSKPPHPVTVHADTARITQVFDNLLDNAAKYTGRGGRVWLSLCQDGDEAVISVRDTGRGLPPELIPRIFDLFEQGGAGLARTDGGLGLGLNLVKRLIEKHGGTVRARSAGRDQGSEFVIRLPIAAAGETPAGGATEAVGQTPRRVLVIEDNADVGDALQALLEAIGHTVQVARNGETGLAAVPSFEPDVVLIDLGLPDMPGYTVAQQLREAYPPGSLQLIALTGYGREEDRERSRAAGFDAHLTKPASIETLLKLLAA